jgi:predicted nuclease with TOPRIM domain
MEEKEKSQNNKVFLILAVILLLLSGILGWQLYEQKSANDQLVAEKAQLIEDKTALNSELDELLDKYKSLEDENGQLSEEMEAQRQELLQLKADVEKYKGDASKLSWYKSQLAQYKDKYDVLEARYDSLQDVAVALQGEVGTLKTEVTQQQSLNRDLTDENMGLANKVALGSVLTAYKITIEGVRGKNEKPQTRGKRVEKLRTCFILSENSIARGGQKDIYFRIVGPDGKVLSQGRGDEFELEGTMMTYSMVKQINYENRQMDICMYYNAPTEGFIDGKYTVEIYADKALIGSSSLTFK